MVCIREGICPRCHNRIMVCRDGDLCTNCYNIVEEEEREKFLNQNRHLTLEQRIDQIEWELYKMSKEIRSNALHHMTF